MLYTASDMGNGVIRVWDYSLGTAYVIERDDKAVIIDATMGQGNICQFIKDHVLKNKDIDLELIITHNANDHTAGLAGFVGASQLKTVYVPEAESELTRKFLGPDAGKIKYVNDGDLIALGGKNVEIFEVPGHAGAHIVMFYENNIFSGDAVGSGDAWISGYNIEYYIRSVQRLLDRMGTGKYTILAGHSGEFRAPLTEEYVRQVLSAAQGLVDGSIVSVPYWRTIGGASSSRRAGTFGRATIVHDLNNIRLIKGALRGLKISEGNLNARFSSYTAFYTASVDENVSSVDITPTTLESDYTALTVNGIATVSGNACKVNLNKGINRLPIVVTASDNTARTYTLTITRGN